MCNFYDPQFRECWKQRHTNPDVSCGGDAAKCEYPETDAEAPAPHDVIHHPSHYCKGGIECIDVIRAVVSTIKDPFEAYCTGNIIKYVFRWYDKNGAEDLKKAMEYAQMIVDARK